MRSYKFISNWKDCLLWFPSQLERDFILRYPVMDIKQGIYILYCRWRGEDPWSFHFYSSNFDVATEGYTWVDINTGYKRETNINCVHAFAERSLYSFLNSFTMPRDNLEYFN